MNKPLIALNKPLIVFDMDGVLVDVTESYRETIAQTVKHFAHVDISRRQIQDYKNEGGWNDDWKLSHHIVTRAGCDVPFETVKDYFQSIFLGTSSQTRDDANPSRDREGAVSPPAGLILREQWVARPGVLEALNRQFDFAIFTGRPKADAVVTLNRFANGLFFSPLVAMEDVANHKPHPEGLLAILQAHLQADNGRKVYYIGDTVDDARCARSAKVPFIGIAAPANPLYIDLVFLFQEEGAYAIVDDINYLAEVFAS